MAIRSIDPKTYVVQVQRNGRRKTKRVSGTLADAKKVEAQLTVEMEQEAKLDEAAAMLGVTREEAIDAAKPVPTFREFFGTRWVEHAKIVQKESTRRTMETPFRYLLFYLGDKPLDELLRPSEVNAFVEKMKRKGPVTFTIRKDGQPRRSRVEQLTNATVNKSLQCLQALLNLAHSEDVVPSPPRVDMLPTDDSTPVLPPTEEQLQALLTLCRKYLDVAPLLADIVEFTSETGLRRGEVFNLRVGSVDLARAAIRIETQGKGRVVNGVAWRPKHNKWREVPLSVKARAVVERRITVRPDDSVFPNQGGSPYIRMEHSGDALGKGWFDDAIADAGLKGRVSFHGLRHMFAVRLLTRGVPITIVSELLGHSDINLTVKRYGRFASDAKVKWQAVAVLNTPEMTPPVAPEPVKAPERRLGVIDGGKRGRKAAR